MSCPSQISLNIHSIALVGYTSPYKPSNVAALFNLYFSTEKNPHRMEKKNYVLCSIFMPLSTLCNFVYMLMNVFTQQTRYSIPSLINNILWFMKSRQRKRYLFKRHISDKDLLKNTTGFCSSAICLVWEIILPLQGSKWEFLSSKIKKKQVASSVVIMHDVWWIPGQRLNPWRSRDLHSFRVYSRHSPECIVTP